MGHGASDPLVSIVINNHNYGAYVRAAIESALAQTYEHVEVIVVDAGSTDSSREIIGEYGDRVITVFKEAEGQASTCNAGIARSSGQVIFVLDSDDVLYPDIAGRAARIFANDPDVAWVQFRLEVIDQRGMAAGVLKPAAHLPRRSGDLRSHIVAFPWDVTRMATSGNAFSMTALKQVLPIPEDVYRPSGVDWYLCPLMGLFGKTIFLDDIGGGYRLHDSNSNWYERPGEKVDLRGIRRDLELMCATSPYILNYARQLGLRTPPEITSVSMAAERMLSLKLDPATHPIAGDTVWRALGTAMRATRRRTDVRGFMKLMFYAWFGAMAVAPRPAVEVLAEPFLFPNKRGPLNPLLAKLHTTQGVPAGAQP